MEIRLDLSSLFSICCPFCTDFFPFVVQTLRGVACSIPLAKSGQNLEFVQTRLRKMLAVGAACRGGGRVCRGGGRGRVSR